MLEHMETRIYEREPMRKLESSTEIKLLESFYSSDQFRTLIPAISHRAPKPPFNVGSYCTVFFAPIKICVSIKFCVPTSGGTGRECLLLGGSAQGLFYL